MADELKRQMRQALTAAQAAVQRIQDGAKVTPIRQAGSLSA